MERSFLHFTLASLLRSSEEFMESHDLNSFSVPSSAGSISLQLQSYTFPHYWAESKAAHEHAWKLFIRNFVGKIVFNWVASSVKRQKKHFISFCSNFPAPRRWNATGIFIRVKHICDFRFDKCSSDGKSNFCRWAFTKKWSFWKLFY